MFYTLILFLLLSVMVNCVFNMDLKLVNRCKGLEKYKNEINCNFNPDDYLDVSQIIRRHGYPVETHVIETEDGYLLGVHRISGARNGTKGRQPVFIQHGLAGSSADWILNGNNSLGFVLADQGYDVWLGNNRGNSYSTGHMFLPLWSDEYWNFSFHEMGIYDLPAVIFHINNVTGKAGELLYIGHSMGTTQFFVLSSILPNIAENIKFMVALAPMAYLTYSPLYRFIASFSDVLYFLLSLLGVQEIRSDSDFSKFLDYICDISSQENLCQTLALITSGTQKSQINLDILPTIMSHDNDGTSVKSIIHFGQEISNNGQFQYFDYGRKENMVRYNTSSPPLYPVENIKSLVYLFYAINDKAANYTDVVRFSKKLPNLAGLYKVPDENFGHPDFLYGRNVFELVYEPLLNILHEFS